ncbi:MAG: ACP S-malonyltransferase [Deltaproteobacteria bacterium]|nr:ACP S-malonyltransferase [Deltaproteobacteria bacterium]
MQGISIVFPGQGSQEPGMGRDVAEQWSEAMDLWKKAEALSGLPLREIYWDSDETAMAVTRNLQPALAVVNIALWRFVASKIEPAAVAGHSLGEYAALCAVSVLSVDQMLELVCLRGKLMDEATNQDGRMAAILKLDQAKVEGLVAAAAVQTGREIRIANYNTPAQFVISGHAQAVDVVCASAEPLKGRAMVLPVSNAFHSPYMAEAGAELARYMDKLDWRDPKIPIYLNVTAHTETTGAAIKDIMKRQMTSSVLWTQTIENQYASGLRTFAELGPKGALSRMVGQILKDKDGVKSVSISTLEHAAQVEELLS